MRGRPRKRLLCPPSSTGSQRTTSENPRKALAPPRPPRTGRRPRGAHPESSSRRGRETARPQTPHPARTARALEGTRARAAPRGAKGLDPTSVPPTFKTCTRETSPPKHAALKTNGKTRRLGLCSPGARKDSPGGRRGRGARACGAAPRDPQVRGLLAALREGGCRCRLPALSASLPPGVLFFAGR